MNNDSDDDYEFLDNLKDSTQHESMRHRLNAIAPHKLKRWKQYLLTGPSNPPTWYRLYNRYWQVWQTLNHKTYQLGWDDLYNEKLVNLEDEFDALNELKRWDQYVAE